MKRINISITLLLLSVAASFISISGTGCGTLDPSGPYKGDTTLYRADQTITTSYDLLNGFLLWEYNNRAACEKISPQIKVAADDIRAKAPPAFASAIAVRDAYSLNKSQPNASALQMALGTLQALITQANTWLTVPGAPPPATNAPQAALATIRASIAK